MTRKLFPNFAKRLKRRRAIYGLSQNELARRVGVTRGYVAAMESDGRMPGPSICVAIADELKVDLTWLLTGEGEP